MKDIRDMGIGESFYLKMTVATISKRTGEACEFDEERIDINDLIIAKLEKIKKKIKNDCILHEEWFADIDDLEKCLYRIDAIVNKEISELKGENNG